MKIYPLLKTFTLGAFLALNLTGCGENHSAAKGHADHDEKAEQAEQKGQDEHADQASHPEVGHGVEFKEGKGLHVPDSASKMLGVKTIEVVEGQIEGGLNLSLRVFAHGSKPDSLLATGSVSTNEAAMLQPGLAVQIQQPQTKPTVAGVVTQIDKAGAMGLADVIVELPKSSTLQIGSFVDATVAVKSDEGIVLVPREALLETSEGHFVYVVNGEHLFRTPVTAGTRGVDSVEIKEGLYAGDQVVLQPVMPLWLAELQAIRGGKACADGH